MAKTTKQDLDNIKAAAEATGKGLSDAIGKVTELNGLTGTLSSYFSGISDTAFEFAGALTKAEESETKALQQTQQRVALQRKLAETQSNIQKAEEKISAATIRGNQTEREAAETLKTRLESQKQLIEIQQQINSEGKITSGINNDIIQLQSEITTAINNQQNALDAGNLTLKQQSILHQNIAELEQQQLEILQLQSQETARLQQQQQKQNQQLQKALGHITKFITGIGAAANAFLGLERQTLQVQKNLSTTNDEAEKFRKQSVDIAGSYLSMSRSIKDVQAAQKEYTDLYGTTLGMSKELLGNTVDLATRLGTTTQNAAAAFQAMQGMTGASDDQTMALQTNLGLLATTAKVPVDKVFQDMATASEQATRFLSGGDKAIFKMTVQARQLGLSINDVANVAEGLLNIEKSLQGEMELQVMTGKNLNFAGAREMALRGKILGATKAIREQVGDINNLNYLQIASLEEATGLSIKQLRTMDRQQSVLDNMTKEEREKIELAMEKYGVDDLAQAQQALAAEAQVNMAKQLENLVGNISTLISGPMGWVAGTVQFAGSLAQVALALNTIKGIEITTATARMMGAAALGGIAGLAMIGGIAVGAAALVNRYTSDKIIAADGTTQSGAFGSMIPDRKVIIDGRTGEMTIPDLRDDIAAAPGLAEMMQSETPIQAAVIQNTTESSAQSTRASGTATATESPLMQQMVKLLTELVTNSRNPIPAVISEKGIGELNRSIIAQNQRRTQFDNTFGRTV